MCIKLVSDLQQVGGFHRHDITEILLKVALNTTNQTKPTKDVFQTTISKPHSK
jgi:hypothetical protein